MPNSIEKKPNPIDKVCAQLVTDQFRDKLQQALPPNINAEKFCRTAVNAIQMHPQQNKFNNCDTRTLFVSCQKAASDGLMLDGREATLVAFWNKDKKCNDISYMPMVQGLVKVARNSGEIVSIDAHVVYESDSFKFSPGVDPQPIFDPDWKLAPSKRGEPILAYCVVHLKDGTLISPEPMHKERIMQIARGGNNAEQYDAKKGSHWVEWWKKTAIKNALKYAPKSSELLSVEQNDNDAQGFSFIRDVSPKDKSLEVNQLFHDKPALESIGVDSIDEGTAGKEEKKPAKKTEKVIHSKSFDKLSNAIDMAENKEQIESIIVNAPEWLSLESKEAVKLQEIIDDKRKSFNS